MSMQIVPPEQVTDGFKIFTEVDDNDHIISEVQQVYGDQIVNATQTIIDTRDQHVREMLINLGWTPPSES